MGLNLPALEAVLKKMEAADLAILEASLVPALFADLESLIPAKDASIVPFIQLAEAPVQTALAGLLAKLVPA